VSVDGFGLVTQIIDHLQIITASNYGTITNLGMDHTENTPFPTVTLFLCICCHRNVFTEPLPRNGRCSQNDRLATSLYTTIFAQGIAEQRSRGAPAGWRSSAVEAFPSHQRMHV
jgi:hypothetical protein